MKYIIVFLSLAILSYLYYKLGNKFNIIDKPNHRSSHSQITIRGGGVIFYFALLIYEIFSGFSLPWLFIGATLIAVLSFIDDIKPLSPKLRFPFQCLAAILVMYEVGLDINIVFLLIILVISVGFINAFNFMDGINGITGMYSIVILISVYIYNEYFISFISSELILFLIFSVIIFGFYNFRKKALFFAGDVGSITMAVLILYIILTLFQKTHSISVLLLVSVYGVDSVITIIRRILLKERITEAHRHHLYQNFVDSKKFTHLQTAVIYSCFQGFIFIVFLLISELGFIAQLMITILILVLLVSIYFISIKMLSKDKSVI